MRHGWNKIADGQWESDDWRWLIREDDDGFSVRDGAEEAWLEPVFETFSDAEGAIHMIEKDEAATLFALLGHDGIGGVDDDEALMGALATGDPRGIAQGAH